MSPASETEAEPGHRRPAQLAAQARHGQGAVGHRDLRGEGADRDAFRLDAAAPHRRAAAHAARFFTSFSGAEALT